MVLLFGNLFIPVSAKEVCEHASGVKTVIKMEHDGANASYCSYSYVEWMWTCCKLVESSTTIKNHQWQIVMASHGSCKNACGYTPYGCPGNCPAC